MEAFNFTVANEDCNLYTYDMRKLQSAACMHKASLSGYPQAHVCRTAAEEPSSLMQNCLVP